MTLLFLGAGAGLAGGLRLREAFIGGGERVTLLVDSAPGGARVAIDGEDVGVTPLLVTRDLAEGASTPVTLTRVGAEAALAVTRQAQRQQGASHLHLDVPLLPAGRVHVTSLPPGARASLDGRDVGVTPLTLERVGTDATHNVELSLDGFMTEAVAVPTARGEEWSAHRALRRPGANGSVVVEATGPAQLLIDGVAVGPAGPTARVLPPGPHEVVLRAPGVPPTRPATITSTSGATKRYLFPVGNAL
jgi:hypothetical protein